MRTNTTRIRPAMTAIAAVIALSSTPLFAQSVDTPAAETPAPVSDTTPAPVAADPLAPTPTADTTTTADPLAPQAAATPAPRKTTPARTTAARSRPAPARVASAAPAVAAPPAASLAPADVTPAEPVPPVQPEVAPVAAPVADPPATAEAPTMAIDEGALPIAGAAGLGLLALAGAGLAVRRRRRRREAAEFEAQQQYAESLAEPVFAEPAEVAEPQRATMEPTFVRAFAPASAAAAAPVVAATPVAQPTGPATELHEGFDLSRFGPHVQAAYRGPTADNPSLSLKTRLRRAAAMDQMARKAGTEAVTARPAKAPVSGTAMPQQAKGDFMLRRADSKPGVKPVHSN